MAFWDNWFKVPCEECAEKFKKEELVSFEERQVCSKCHVGILEDRRVKEAERLERAAAEEAARERLGDRNFQS